ncbi:hypothetical protein ACFL3F_02250 [Planctomycetota bacterium]
MFIRSAVFLWVILGLVIGGHAGELVPFVIPARSDPDSAIAVQEFSPIAVDGPRLGVSQTPLTNVPEPGQALGKAPAQPTAPLSGFFSYRDKRVRLWGVNLSSGANFPSHAAAPQVAQRLASVGVNSVRCHHMDSANWPRGLWDPQHQTKISATALDRLDFFIHELAQRGIWVNLNLHVGRAHSRFLDIPAAPRKYDKITNIFTPALIAAQKQFARELLNHRNPYRQHRRYADDPAVAILEISNENSFFMWDGDETLRQLPPFYHGLLEQQYNTWLLDYYHTREALAQAWSQDVEPLGKNVLENSNLQIDSSNSGPTHWKLEQHADTRALLSPTHGGSQDTALLIEPLVSNGVGWHLQLNQDSLTLKAGRYYTVMIEAAGVAARSIHCSAGQAHDPWQNMGLSRSLALTPAWQTFQLGFVAKADEDNARVNISFGDVDGSFKLRRITLHPGGQVGLTAQEDPVTGTVALFTDHESPARLQDRLVFLAETEKAYFDRMYSFLKEDLDCRALVTGTIVFGPLGLYAQSEMDFIDAHAYWQHPQFPGQPWDAGNWLLHQKAMTAFPNEATLFALAAKRLQGKPFTVSEYNHPAPLDSQAECVPLLASFGAAQDWDGLWLYTYSHTHDRWDREVLNNFFDIDSNPAKWGFMHAGSAIFRAGTFGRLATHASVSLNTSPAPLLKDLARLHQQHDSDLFGALAEIYSTGRSNLLTTQLSATFANQTQIFPLATKPPSLLWSTDKGQGFYGGEGPGALVLTGFADLFVGQTGGECIITSPSQLSLTLTTLDNKPWETSQRLLVTACGRCENTRMVFSENRQTLGRNWGEAPVCIEPVSGKLALPAGSWQARALDASGKLCSLATVERNNSTSYLKMEARHQTLWYLLIKD